MLGSDSLTLSLLQIESLVFSAAKKNHSAIFPEAFQPVEQHRPLSERHFIRCLFSAVDFSPYESKNIQKDLHQVQFLNQKFKSVLLKPNFISLFCYAINKPLPSAKGFGSFRQLLSQISRVLKLNRIQEIIIGLALIQSDNPHVALCAQQWVRQKVPDFVRMHFIESGSVTGTQGSGSAAESDVQHVEIVPADKGDFQNASVTREIGVELLHFILGHLLDDRDHLGCTMEQLGELLSFLRRDFPRSHVPLVLSALLYSDIRELNPARVFDCTSIVQGRLRKAITSKYSCSNDSPPNRSGEPLPLTTPDSPIEELICDSVFDDSKYSLLADLLEELGPLCTKTLEAIRPTLAEFDQSELTAPAVAKCLCMFMRTADTHSQSLIAHPFVAGESNGENDHATDELPWRKALVCGLTRPSSMILSSRSMNGLVLTSSSSEPRLTDAHDVMLQPEESGRITWNVDNFLTVVFEQNPTLTMDQIVSELDCPEFFLADRSAFLLVKQILFRCNPLPVGLFYRPWRHPRGQLSLLRFCHAYPDVICLAYWPHRSVDLSAYRLTQSSEQSQVQIWKNVDYLQALLSLSELGLFSDVYRFLQEAFLSCPDIFTATLFEANPNTARSTMLSHAMVYYLSPRTNSSVVLQTAWNGCKGNHLSGADLQQQRFLLLNATLECTSQLTAGVLEPSTLPQYNSVSSLAVQSSLTRMIELLAGVTETTCSAFRAPALLSIVLGTTESPSSAVSVLLPPVGVGLPISPNPLTLPCHMLPTPMQAIDLALVLLVRIANAVSLAASRATTASAEAASISSIQNAIRVFLLQWFTECVRDKELAEPFAFGIVEYLRVRYPSYVLNPEIPSVRPASAIAALPTELRKPSAALLTRLIQSAQAALKSVTCCLRQSILTEVNQALSIYLQNLSTGFATTSNSNSQALRSITSVPSAFGLAMKSSIGSSNGTAPHMQSSQQPSRGSFNLTSGNLHQPFQTSDLAAALASVTNFNSTAEENFSRSSTLNSFTGRTPIQQNAVQHGQLSLTNQSKSTENASLHGLSFPSEHQPVALSFANEPIKIDLSKEAEVEAYGFFQKLLKGINTPDDMFKTVCEYATQGNISQRKLLDGILRMLADEVSQYLPDYPELMLPLIADLYGSILAASTQLLSLRALSMLWRALLTRLHSLPVDTSDSPLFRTIIHILLKAKNTFTQFVNLPSCLIGSPVFKLFPHELQEYILSSEMLMNNYVRSQQTGSSGSKNTGTLNQSSQLFAQHQVPASIGAISTVLTVYPTQPEPPFKPPDTPEETITDRIYFLFNNVSQSNAKEKSAELADILTDERLLPWFAFYLIGKRVPVEHTFHDLFAAVLDQIQERIPSVRPRVMHELIRNVKLLLRTMRKDRDDMQARITLKNLGNFLGLITLARNKPLLHDDLNVKDLVYEAYHKGPISSQYVVPFVARIVKSATDSIVFKPPNPWTMAILKVFRELYDLKDVKDCIRFEIELLYRQFTLNLEDIPLAHFLRDRNHANNLEIQLCFFVPNEGTNVSTSSAVVPSASGVDNGSVVPASSSSEISTATITPSLPSQQQQQQQQQVLNMLAALQKQQQAAPSTQPTGLAAGSLDVMNTTTNMYSTSGPDLVSVMHSSLAAGASGQPNPSTRALVLAAALAASQSQKPLQVGQQFAPSGPATTGNSSGTTFSMQQKQVAAAVAALQQLQSQQTVGSTAFPGTNIPPTQIGAALASDSTLEVPGGNLRYEEVSLRTIRACLNLDDLVAAAAAITNRPGAGGASNVTQAAIALLQSNPRLRTLIEPAITRAINELTTPVFERCARITVTTVAAVIRKDFALDPDPNRMLYAARQMVRHLAAGMSLITAREALGMSLVTGLKNIILAEVQSASGQEKEAVQRLAHLVVAKSMHTCLAFMQKSVAEKAVNDVEKKLEPDVKLRNELGPRRFLEQASQQLAVQQNNMPESLRLTVGGPTPSEMAVYEEFGRVIPGFAQSPTTSSMTISGVGQPTSPGSTAVAQAAAAYMHQQQQGFAPINRMQRQISAGPSGIPMLKSQLSQPQLNQISNQQQQHFILQQSQQQPQQQTPVANLLDKIIGQIERHLAFISNRLCSTTDPMIRSLRCLIDAIHMAKNNRDSNVAMAVIATVVQSFLEHYRPSVWRDQPRGLETMEHFKEAHMLTLRHMLSSDQTSFGYAWVTKQVTQTWIHLDGGSQSRERLSIAAHKIPCENIDESADTPPTGAEEKTHSTEATDPSSSSWSGWKTIRADSTLTDTDLSENRLNSIKWNWEAFAELLKVHVVYLSQVDAYLAQEVAAGHPGAITFVIDLLDNFVLPCPAGTSVGAAAAAAADYARTSSSSLSNCSGQAVGQSGTSGPPSSASVNYSASAVPQPPINQSKREFTVLNEYDLWSTLEGMRGRVNCLNALLPSRPISLTDPIGLRLRLACARVRGLLDLGLLEQSPLFSPSSGLPVPIGALYSGCSQAREFDDPPNLQEKVELLMRNWVEIYQSPRQRDPATTEAMLAQLAQIGVFPNMDNLVRLLRLTTIFVIERALKQLRLQDQQPSQQQSVGMAPGGGSAGVPLTSLPNANSGSNMSVARVGAYVELDAYARLISVIIKRSSDQSDQPNLKVILLNKVLGIIAGTLLQEHEVRRDWFHPMPFERIIIMLFVELNSLSLHHSMTGGIEISVETHGDHQHGASEFGVGGIAADKSLSKISGSTNLSLQQQLPLIFCHLLHCLRPEKATAFVFSWLEMLAHRWFVSRILAAHVSPQLKSAYQAMYAQLLVDLLKFLGYFLQNALMPKPIQCLYKATLRLFLVLIHDFPEFVSDYYALFCDVVPSNSIQMRNLILSALPKRGIPSSDPLQAPPVDNLASLEDPTGYCMEAGSRLPEPMRCELDAYLATRAPVKLLSELVTMLRRADDIIPPLPPTQFAYHPQQQARHQQALAAYAAALAANDTGSTPVTFPVNFVEGIKIDEKISVDDPTATNGQPEKLSRDISEPNEPTSSNDPVELTAARPATGASSSSATAAALLWGVRATQQLATFGLADGMHYNVELMTNLTLYVCITAIRNLREKGMPLNMGTIAHTPQMDIIQSLVLNLDNEGRYLLLNCMANQLRYPNSHTYYFSYTILYLFSEQSKEQVKEQISRVLMERLIVNRPHPWGLLMTSAELLRNPAYRFWEHEFARCNPEIEAIVTIVARSCIPNFQIPSISGGSSNVRNVLSSSTAIPSGDRRRQASPLTRGSAAVTDGCNSSVRVARALNSFIPG